MVVWTTIHLQVNEIDLNPDHYILVTKRRDGTDVKITKKFIIPRM